MIDSDLMVFFMQKLSAQQGSSALLSETKKIWGSKQIKMTNVWASS